RRLERLHPDWLGPAFDRRAAGAATTNRRTSTSTFSSSTNLGLGAALDVASVVKATQAISGEVKPQRLYARLMATIIENAGAQRGCLILRAEPSGELRVEARADIAAAPHAADAHEVVESAAIDACEQVCPEIVRYVARTLDPVVIDDASADRVHRCAAYAERRGIKSILCVPV